MSSLSWSMIIALIIYLTPSIVALAKRNRRTKVILFNIFLGWTVVMWIISLVWACKREEVENPVYYQPPQPTYYQPPQPTYQQPQPTYQQPQAPQAPQQPQPPQQPPQPPYQG